MSAAVARKAASATPEVTNAITTLTGKRIAAAPTAIADVAPWSVRSDWRRWIRSAASTVVPPLMTVAPTPANVVRIA